ncbi:MAG TPA: Wzz/FepE/Etk N-terminal domain-containing protein [Bryobacteraceae bacterium]|nr:Wzz/FepE/Etk N-terminal domain-containing protein [Bryobacteraceae bacterium]
MYDSFDAFEYIDYVRTRWRAVAVACAAALLISLSVSLLLPKRYTATASVVIEPPGGADVRSGTAVSAVYLESLKTYESFASSDSLFARAAEQYHLQDATHPGPIEGLKRRVLKVYKPRDTKILEVSVTLADPKVAQKVAQFLADETVAMNRRENQASDNAFVEQAQQQLIEAGQRLENDQKKWADLAANEPVGSLQSEIDAAIDFEAKLRQQLVDAQADAAEYQQSSGQFAHEQLQAVQSRAALMEKQIEDLGREVQQKNSILARRGAERDALQAELNVARSVYESDTSRVRELRAAAGSHTEQLRVIDPGIVPQQPSSPNISLNVIAALMVALVASLVYLSASFAYRRRRVGFQTAAARGMRA